MQRKFFLFLLSFIFFLLSSSSAQTAGSASSLSQMSGLLPVTFFVRPRNAYITDDAKAVSAGQAIKLSKGCYNE